MDDDATKEFDGSTCDWINIRAKRLGTEKVIGEFNTQSFNTLMNLKPLLIRELLDEYDELYWADSDIVFYSDPIPYIQSPLSFQQDCPNDGNRLCAGNFYVKKTEEVIEFFTKWLEAIRQNPTQFDQQMLNYIIRTEKDLPEIHIFPTDKFQRGYDAIKLKWWRREDKVCIHFNYIEGVDNKIEAMKIAQAWYKFF
jgi:hypothetical protein